VKVLKALACLMILTDATHAQDIADRITSHFQARHRAAAGAVQASARLNPLIMGAGVGVLF